MIGTIPISKSAPLDYRYAIDATLPTLFNTNEPLIICDTAELNEEVYQRMPILNGASLLSAVLWIEPNIENWRTQLQNISSRLVQDGTLMIVASRPLAIIIPERRSWAGKGLGLYPTGFWQLHRALKKNDFSIEKIHGIHTLLAIGINFLGQVFTKLNRPDLSDRLLFASKLYYQTSGLTSHLSTVAIIFATKGKV